MSNSPAHPASTLRSEDWVACWLGFALILLALAGVQPALPSFSWTADSLGAVFAPDNLAASAVLGALFLVVAIGGIRLMGASVRTFVIGFPAVFLLAWLSQFIAGQAGMKTWGLTYVITGLVLGLFISNVLRVPRWMQGAVRTEYYIKTGLVLLGSNILIGEILQAGMLGVAQAFFVILVIWYGVLDRQGSCGSDDEFSAMLATGLVVDLRLSAASRPAERSRGTARSSPMSLRSC